MNTELSASGVHLLHLDAAHASTTKVIVPHLLETEAAIERSLHLHEHSHHTPAPALWHAQEESRPD